MRQQINQPLPMNYHTNEGSNRLTIVSSADVRPFSKRLYSVIMAATITAALFSPLYAQTTETIPPVISSTVSTQAENNSAQPTASSAEPEQQPDQVAQPNDVKTQEVKPKFLDQNESLATVMAERQSGNLLQRAHNDLHAVWGKHVHISSGQTAAVLVTTGLLLTFDEKLSQWSDGHIKPKGWARSVTNLTNDLGSWEGFAAIGGIYALGGKKEKETAKLAFAAVANTALIVSPAKRLLGRKRPFQSNDEMSFGPLGGCESMPSGHTASAFAMATVLAHQYPKQKWIFYGLAASVGFARIQRDAHFPADVFVGGTIGAYCAKRVIANKVQLLNWKF